MRGLGLVVDGKIQRNLIRKEAKKVYLVVSGFVEGENTFFVVDIGKAVQEGRFLKVLLCYCLINSVGLW